jgi:hypothetical protein
MRPCISRDMDDHRALLSLLEKSRNLAKCADTSSASDRSVSGNGYPLRITYRNFASRRPGSLLVLTAANGAEVYAFEPHHMRAIIPSCLALAETYCDCVAIYLCIRHS